MQLKHLVTEQYSQMVFNSTDLEKLHLKSIFVRYTMFPALHLNKIKAHLARCFWCWSCSNYYRERKVKSDEDAEN